MTEEMQLEATPPPKKKRAKKVRRKKRKTAAPTVTGASSTGAESTSPAQAVAEATQIDVGQVTATLDDAPKSADTKTKTTRSTRKRTTKAKRRPARKTAGRRSTKSDSSDALADVPDATGGELGASPPASKEGPQPTEPEALTSAPESAARQAAEATTAEATDAEPRPQSARPARKRGGGARRRKAKEAPKAAQAEPQADQPAVGSEPGKTRGRKHPERTTDKDLESPPTQAIAGDAADRPARRSNRKPDADTAPEETSTKPSESKARRGRGARSTRRTGGRSARNKDAEAGSTEIVVSDREPSAASAGQSTMLINVSAGDECRIAIVKQGRLEELFIERAASQSRVGNIYKGTVMNVEPSIQAAFIDFGIMKNGFLHISDVQPQYFPSYNGEPEDVGRKIPRRNRPPIQECFQRGQEVIVQVIKEGVGTKGPTLTTYLSVPGRFLVMMPGMSRHGVSRKIEDEDSRRAMRDMLSDMELPQGIGFILRTAGLGQSKRELQRDLKYLLRLWKQVVERVKRLDAPAELYQESDLVTRTLRDVYSPDFCRIIVDDVDATQRAREFLKIAMPRSKVELEHYAEREPLFHRFGIEEQLEDMNKRTVPLKSGGSLVIDTTEALVAIDVNSGKCRAPADAEELAFQVDMEAAEEIARQLRLRDLGGLIVCDFIDMRLDRHKRAVERALRDALKSHKERARILRMSAFGLIEMTRQRRGPSMKRNTFFECSQCQGTGLVKMPESVVLDVMRVIQLAANKERAQRITVNVSSAVAFEILNRKRAVIHSIESETGKEVTVLGNPGFTSDQVEYTCEDARGNVIPLTRTAMPDRRHRRRPR
ncbi:MAG: Rne/Rng family ribonuclease [Phycisphaerae bacterium]